MEDTHCGDQCPFKKMGYDKCPNELESWWQPADELQPKLVKDCAPKRMLLMMQQLYNRMDGVQKQQTEVCGQTYRLTEGLKMMAKIQMQGKASPEQIENLEEAGLIEQGDNAIPTISDSSSR